MKNTYISQEKESKKQINYPGGEKMAAEKPQSVKRDVPGLPGYRNVERAGSDSPPLPTPGPVCGIKRLLKDWS